MKASKDFKYALNGMDVSTIKSGEDIPEIAQSYAKKHGFSDAGNQKAAQKPENKAMKPPQNKAK